MAILEKEVYVGIMKNAKYYESLGYVIPKYKDKKGRMSIKRGTKILVKVDDLSNGSNVKLTKICDECGDISCDIRYDQILISRNMTDGKDRCEKCGSIYAGSTQKNNVEYEKTLENFAKINDKDYLLLEFSDKNTKEPNKISFGTKDEYLWNCPDCKSEYSMEVNRRTIGINCPFCSGMRVNHTNCLNNIKPDIAKLLKNPQRGYEITVGSGKKEIFICDQCGFEQTKSIYNVVKDGFYCVRCSDNISYSEKFTANLLYQINISYEIQKTFIWSDSKRYDFFIPSLNCIIETHGKQHYKDTGFSTRTLNQEQENDLYKMKLAKFNQIDKYITLDCRESNIEFLKNTFLNSELCELYCLNEVNWEQCHEFACSNLVKIVCDTWNSGVINTIEIGEIVKLSRHTVVRYLKKGAEIGWCSYDASESSFRTHSNNGKKSGKKLIQLSNNGEIIKIWNSSHEAAKELGLSHGNISLVCKGKRRSSGGFRWVYQNDYERNDMQDFKNKRKKKVIQISKDNKFIKEFESIAQATRETGINSSNISLVCNGTNISAGGYRWLYKEYYDKQFQMS